jgi:hypothetical protein
MSESDLHTPEGRAAAFAAFRAQPYNRFMTKLRYRRADQIREIVAEPEKMTLDRFNHEIWQIGHRVLLRGVTITDRIFDGNLDEARVLEIDGEFLFEGYACDYHKATLRSYSYIAPPMIGCCQVGQAYLAGADLATIQTIVGCESATTAGYNRRGDAASRKAVDSCMYRSSRGRRTKLAPTKSIATNASCRKPAG